MTELTRVFEAVARGDGQAAQRLLPLVYDELHRLARAQLARFAPDLALTPTEVVHEAYLRIWRNEPVTFEGHRHFFFVAIRAMRDVLVENARRKDSLKRGGDHTRVTMAEVGIAMPSEDVRELYRALEKLEREKPENARVVRLRYFGGLTHEEIAEVTGCSRATVKRRWTQARAWLRRELSSPL